MLAGCCLSAVAMAMVCSAPVQSETEARRTIALPAQSLADAVRAIALTYGRPVGAPADLLTARQARAVRGNFTMAEALAALLAGSGLEAVPVAKGYAIRVKADTAEAVQAESEILVTGSRIRGAQVASPVIRLERETLRKQGRATLAEALAGVPQNFGGGQNPGIGFNVPEGSGADIGGGASVNLRGLGSDATLTLLDGHRLSYSASDQSVDISAIPFGMVERIEVVPDGASALFGSDAVAGVVNIILRRDLDGLEAVARIGGSTDGGNFQQQYALTGGKRWSSGGILLAYQYDSNSAVVAEDRAYAARRSPGLTLYPAMRHHGAGLSFQQDLASGLTFDVDGLFNTRRTGTRFPLNEEGDLATSRAETRYRNRSWAIAPSLTLRLPADWSVALAGSYGQDRVAYAGDYHFGDTRLSAGDGAYRNRAVNAELSGNGNLATLPGGFAKLAIGAGFRRNSFVRETSVGAAADVDASQESIYGFAELNLPLLGPGQDIPLLRALSLSAAARYERYPGIDSVATPKLGLIWDLTGDLSLKASWGKSFRAPTFYEAYQPVSATLHTASSLGAEGAPTGATAIRLEGGSNALTPERSTNWSTTLALHPRVLPELSVEISYFHVDYRDRIVTPIPFPSTALSDPTYASFVQLDPSRDVQAAALGSAVSFINLTPGAYDPGSVVAIVDNTNVNAGRQRVQGVDLLVRYAHRAGDARLSTTLDASWLTSDRQIGPGQPQTQLAGILFNPPHFRARGVLGWEQGAWAATGAINYIGSVRDTRGAFPARVSEMAPFDLTLRWQAPPGSGPLDGLEVTVSAQNLFNESPAPIEPDLYIDAPYDSTNYSPLGRVISLMVRKTW